MKSNLATLALLALLFTGCVSHDKGCSVENSESDWRLLSRNVDFGSLDLVEDRPGTIEDFFGDDPVFMYSVDDIILFCVPVPSQFRNGICGESSATAQLIDGQYIVDDRVTVIVC